MALDWRVEVREGLVPQEVAAGLATGTIFSTDLPEIATWWLEAGRDSPAMRELGGAATVDTWGVISLWQQLCDEVGIAAPALRQAATVDARRILARWRSGRAPTVAAMDELNMILICCFDVELDDGLDIGTQLLADEADAGWGRARDDVLADASRRMAELCQKLGERPRWP